MSVADALGLVSQSALALLNPGDKAAVTLSNGDLTVDATGTGWGGVRATVSKNAGKWYWEARFDSAGGNYGLIRVGIALANYALVNPLGSAGSYGTDNFERAPISASVGDVIGIAWDASGGTIAFYKNNVQKLSLSNLTAGTYYPAVSTAWAGNKVTMRFLAASQSYTPPSGYVAIGG